MAKRTQNPEGSDSERSREPKGCSHIDTPQTRKPRTPVECDGEQPTAYMKRLALRRGRGRVVTPTSDQTGDATDRFGRLLA